MKKLLLVLCIAFGGNIYGQVPNRDFDEIINRIDSDLFYLQYITHTPSWSFDNFVEYTINQEDAVAYYAKKNEWEEALYAQRAMTDLADVRGAILLYDTWATSFVKSPNSDTIKRFFRSMISLELATWQCLDTIKKTEYMYSGSYAISFLRHTTNYLSASSSNFNIH